MALAASLTWRGWPSKRGLKPGRSSVAGFCDCGLAGQRILGEVDVHGTRSTGARDVEGLGDDARDVVGFADQVVVLGHRQRDAADVDLLEGVLAQQRAGHVAVVSATMGTESSWAVAMPVTRLVAPGPDVTQADTDAAAGASVAVGSMCGSLLVADEDRAQLGVVGPDVVEGRMTPPG